MDQIPAGAIPVDQFQSADQVPQPQSSNVPPGSIPVDQFESQDGAYGSAGQKIKAGLEGVAQGVLGPVAPFIEKRYLEVNPEDIRGREEAHPIIHGAGEVAGLLSPVGEGAALTKAGEAVKAGLGLTKQAPLLAKLGINAASQAAEMGLFQAGDEVSRMIKEDPNASAESAISNIGLAGALGGAFGAGLGAVSPLWKAAVGDKAAQLLEDFKGRANFRLNNPDLAEAAGKELSDYYHGMQSAADEVYGPKGLKAQEIEKLVPQASDKIVSQANDLNTKLESSLKDLQQVEDPHAKLLEREIRKFQSAVSNPEASSYSVFDATQKLKQRLQEWGRFNKDMVPLSERGFRDVAKNLSHDIRTSLEDTQVWGKAAERQQSINKAFSDYLPALKDFQSKFTAKLGGDRVIDPGKINTFVNQIGKPNAEIKKEMLENFLKASERYSDVLAKTHANLGLEHPIPKSSVSVIKELLDKPTTGAKFADKLIDHGLTKIAGKTAGGVAGAIAGGSLGHPNIGFLLGEHVLGPVFSSVLPGITKPLMDNPSSIEGLKSAIDYGVKVAKGDQNLSKSVKNVFSAGSKVVTTSNLPDEKSREKLNRIVENTRDNPNALIDNQPKHVGHYLPEHQEAIAQSTTRATQYLQSIQPQPHKPGPLDKPIEPSEAQKMRYDRALDIAHNPAIVLQHIKSGTLQVSDLVDLKSMYPAYFNNMCQKLSNEMMSNHDDRDIPYKTRLSLSLCLGQALDSSMNPQSIQAAQMVQMRKPAQPPQPQGKGKPKSLGNKSVGLYKTPDQASEADHAEKD